MSGDSLAFFLTALHLLLSRTLSSNEFVEARSPSALATFALEGGRVDEAIPMLEQSHRIHASRPDLPDRWSNAINVCRFARALALRGHAATAATLLACFKTEERQQVVSEQWVTEMNDVTEALVRKDLDGAAFDAAWEEGKTLTVDEAVALVLSTLKRDA